MQILYLFSALLGEAAKTKWKGLRDTFRREYQKAVKHKSGAAGGGKSGSTWPYFESLYFLADQMTPRESSGNIPLTKENSLPTNDEYYDEADSPETQNPDNDHPDDVVEVLPSTSTTNPSKRAVAERNPLPQTEQQEPSSKKQQSRPAKRANDIQSRLLQLEEEKLKFFKQRKVQTDVNTDYDYHFLMSLLPHFQTVKPERKLLIQLQLQQVLLNEITSYSTRPSHHMNFLNRPSTGHVLYTPQCTPSPSYELSSPSSFSPRPVSQHSNLSTNNDPVFDTDTPQTEDPNYSIATFVSNFKV